MFRMLKLNPPNGWRAVAWELAIVTAGVLIALAVQQWAEERSWVDRRERATLAIRAEIREHYTNGIEWRVVYPCIMAQIDQLRQRVIDSGERLDPAQVYSQPRSGEFVLRIPVKDYLNTTWQSAINDGVASHFDQESRATLSRHYTVVDKIAEQGWENYGDADDLFGLSRPIPLDPATRYQMLRTLDGLAGRAKIVDLSLGEMLIWVEALNMAATLADTRAEVTRWGTYQFCKAQGLPMRSFKEAMTGVPS